MPQQNSPAPQQQCPTAPTAKSTRAEGSEGQESKGPHATIVKASMAPKPAACCTTSGTDPPAVDAAIKQVDSTAQNSNSECSTSAQASNLDAQHQLPQRARQQRRDKHRHTDGGGMSCQVGSSNQPDLCRAKTKPQNSASQNQASELSRFVTSVQVRACYIVITGCGIWQGLPHVLTCPCS